MHFIDYLFSRLGAMRWSRWLAVTSGLAFAQAVVQGLSALGGLYVVRLLEPREYAIYTVTNTMLGMLAVLADLGLGSAVIALGGRHWHDNAALASVIKEAYRIRTVLAALAVIVVVPLLGLLLARQHLPVSLIVFLICIVLFALPPQLATGILSAVPKLRSNYRAITLIDLVGAVGRFVLIVAAVSVSPYCVSALIAGALAAYIPYKMLQRSNTTVLSSSVEANPGFRDFLSSIVKGQALNGIYWCLQGQLAVWLISLFGTTQSIAEIGALGRLMIIFSVITGVFGNSLVPAFARASGAGRLVRHFVLAVLSTTGIGFLAVTLAQLFTREFLWVLGPHYRDSGDLLPVMVATASLGFIVNTMWMLNSAKAWLRYSWLYVPATLLTQICVFPFVDLATAKGVVVFNFISLLPSVLQNLIMFACGLMTERQSELRVIPIGLVESGSDSSPEAVL